MSVLVVKAPPNVTAPPDSVNPLLKIQSIACECFFLIIDNRVLLTVSGWKTDKWHAIWTTETSLIEVSSGYFASPCCAYE